MDNKKENSSSGCLIVAIVIFVIGTLIYIFNFGDLDFYESGRELMGIVGIAISILICVALFGSKKSSPKEERSENGNAIKKQESSVGCILKGIACVAIFALIINVITSFDSLNYGIGISFVILLVIAIAVFFYYSLKDNG